MYTGGGDTLWNQLFFFNFQTSVTLILTLDRVTWHTVMYRISTSTYKPNFVEIGKLFVDVWTDTQLASFGLGPFEKSTK